MDEKELGYARSEFLVTLEKQTLLPDYEVGSDGVVFFFAGGEARITFLHEGVRRIASMKIPLLKVKVEYVSLDESLQKQFFNRFLRAFQKGGG